MKLGAFRLAAIAIAILAVLDPGITSSRVNRPLVSVIPAAADQDELAERVSRTLDRGFRVVRGRMDGVAGAVLVGRTLPDESASWRGPIVAVTPAPASVTIAEIDAPTSAPFNARVPVRALLSVTGGSGRTLEVTLRSGSSIVASSSQTLSADSTRVAVALTFVPTSTAAARLTVVAHLAGTAASDSAATVVEPTESRYAVLFFDARASWYSTFVRRALEKDPRFVVTSRVLTSRGVASVSGPAPSSLRDASLAGFPAVVVGAPDELGTSDVAALDAYLRNRGGRVVLLLDGRTGANLNRLTGVSRWNATRLESPALLSDSSGGTPLRARELAWPAEASPGVTTHLWRRGSDSTVRPVLWSTAEGAGRVVVSGALDAWHHRDPGTSAFDAFWPQLLADLAASAPRPLEAELSSRVLAPAQVAALRVTVRDAALGSERAVSIRAKLHRGDDSSFVRLWPGVERGTFEASIVAPADSGVYRIDVTDGSSREQLSFLVDPVAKRATRDESGVVSAFVSSRGGFVVPEPQLRDLPSRLASAFRPVSRVETWYPMRSAWWLLPFTAFLGVEWWWRRRRGLA